MSHISTLAASAQKTLHPSGAHMHKNCFTQVSTPNPNPSNTKHKMQSTSSPTIVPQGPGEDVEKECILVGPKGVGTELREGACGTFGRLTVFHTTTD